MKYLSIKNWSKYQHYSKRCPPWVKLHASILDDYAFLCLQDASKAHLMLLFVLASKCHNRIPYDLVFISQKIGATSAVDIEELVLQGFMEVSQDDGKALASRAQNGGTETEAEKRQRRSKDSAKAESWVSEGVELWASVAPIGHGRLGKALKPVIQSHGWPDTKAGLKCYIELSEGKARKIEWFADDAVRWIRLGKMPSIDPATGAFTERGELAKRAALRLA